MAKSSKPGSSSASKPRVLPLYDRVLLREVTSAEAKTASGIIIPQAASPEHDTKKGVVVAVGEGKIVDGKREALSVKVGQTVLYSWGEQITVDGQKYTLAQESQILAILN